MTEEPQDRTRDVARGLTEALNGLTARLAEVKADSEARDDALKRYGKHNRVFIAIDVLLTVVATFATVKAVGASDAAEQNHQASIVSCQSTNEARAQSEQLWSFLIGLSHAPPTATPAQKAQEAKLLALLRGKVAATYAPRDCEALARGEKP